eukprot:11055-Heterococcus_DN1.PRE.1
MHQSSVNMGKGQRLSEKSAATGTVEYVAFGEITRNAQLFVMSNTTPVPPLALLLLCGNLTVELAVDTAVDADEHLDEDPDDEEKPGPISPDYDSLRVANSVYMYACVQNATGGSQLDCTVTNCMVPEHAVQCAGVQFSTRAFLEHFFIKLQRSTVHSVYIFSAIAIQSCSSTAARP